MKTIKKTAIQAALGLLAGATLLAGCSRDDGFADGGDPVAVNFTAGIEAAGPTAYSAAGGTRTTAHEFTGTADAGVPYRDYTDADGFATRAFYPGGATATTTRTTAGGDTWTAPGTRNPTAPGTHNPTAPGTRTTGGGDEWTTTDRVGIFMLAAGGDIATASDRLADNVRYDVTNAATGELSPDGGMPIYYPQTGNVDFVAYYPYGSKGTNAGQVTPGYLYYIGIGGQTDEAAQNARDVLYAKTSNVAKTKTAVALTFGHVLSKITLNVKLGEGLTSLTGDDVTEVSVTGVPLDATLDLRDGSLTAGVTGNFPALKATTANAGANATFSALLVPQPAGGTGRTVVITVNGADYTGTIPDTDDFTAGNHYTYPVTVNETGIEFGAPAITDWDTYDNGSGAAEPLPIEMVKIPAGTFQMGSPDSDIDAFFDEKPQHWVTLTQDFYMSKYEITNAQYAAFLNANGIGSNGLYSAGSYPTWVLVYDSSVIYNGGNNWGLNWDGTKWKPVSGYEDHPVIYVTWYGAYEYAKWIGGNLPTEAQWEYACRAGTAMAYSYGSSADGNYMWYSSNTTHEVGTKRANPWGLYDMHGNVWEWCLDQWDGSNNYPVAATEDVAIENPLVVSGYYRVLRGGGWDLSAQFCRSAYRNDGDPDYAVSNVGFRVVFVP